jgi:cell filamentation protein, protein adenylyltransferase
MKPPYRISTEILKLVASINQKIGEANAYQVIKPSPKLRKQNRIKTIHSTLKIEGNTLTEKQITAILENKRVIGPKKDITEVLNSVNIYDNLLTFEPTKKNSFLKAHKILMTDLIDKPGHYRTDNVGIVQGTKIAHLAPPPRNVFALMGDLFSYLKKEDELLLIKSCVFHYEMEFIHPFLDGNGRMGRLWQTLILAKEFPIFEYLPFETLISKTQKEYYDVLSSCDKSGESTLFIEYMLKIIDLSLKEILAFGITDKVKDIDRLNHFIKITKKEFTRKDYLNVFKNISTATASRDLIKGIEMKLFTKTGEKSNTIYKIINEA